MITDYNGIFHLDYSENESFQKEKDFFSNRQELYVALQVLGGKSF
jgi:hypothetical protein